MIREAVERYISEGFRPMPLWGVDSQGRCLCGGVDRRTGKPCNAGKHSPDPIERDWKDRAYAPSDFIEGQNVALALGPQLRSPDWLVCLDFDGLADPYTIDVHLGAVHTLPRTRTQRSPRGCHLFYWVRPYEALGNWNDCFQTKHSAGWACDIRYARGRINVAPSRSAFGLYRWEDDGATIRRLPEDFLQRIYLERRHRGLPVESRWSRDGKRP